MLKAWFEEKGVPAQIIAFADPLKDFLTMLVGRREPFRGNDAERNAPIPEIMWTDLADDLWDTAKKLKMMEGITEFHPSGRQLMQLFGTEVIRNKFCHDAWVRMANGRAKMFSGVTIVEDVRFPNEATNRHFGGIMDCVIKVVRPGQPLIDHPSENAVDEVDYRHIDKELTNDADIGELSKKVNGFIETFWTNKCSQAAP